MLSRLPHKKITIIIIIKFTIDNQSQIENIRQATQLTEKPENPQRGKMAALLSKPTLQLRGNQEEGRG